jgi:hypothetical protein
MADALLRGTLLPWCSRAASLQAFREMPAWRLPKGPADSTNLLIHPCAPAGPSSTHTVRAARIASERLTLRRPAKPRWLVRRNRASLTPPSFTDPLPRRVAAVVFKKLEQSALPISGYPVHRSLPPLVEEVLADEGIVPAKAPRLSAFVYRAPCAPPCVDLL